MAAITLNTFPNNRVSALTMLFLEKQDLSGLTPEELAAKYDNVFEQINLYFRESRKQKAATK